MHSWMLPSVLTVKNSSEWVFLGCELPLEDLHHFDMSQVKQVDSSFVAAVLYWRKRIDEKTCQKKLRLLNIHESLRSLFSLYEVTEWLSDTPVE